MKYNREMKATILIQSILASYLFTIFLPFFFANGVPLWNRRPLGRVVLLLLVVYAATSSSSSCSILGSPYLSKSCSLATPSIPMIFLLPLLTTTRLGFGGSVMKKHWSTWEASTHGSFFAVTFVPAVFDLASGITMVVKYQSSFMTLLAHLTRNIGTFSPA